MVCRRRSSISFEDMPAELQQSKVGESEELTQQRLAWLEANGLALVDFFTWSRAKFRPQRVPSRRTGALPAAVAPEVAAAQALERERARQQGPEE